MKTKLFTRNESSEPKTLLLNIIPAFYLLICAFSFDVPNSEAAEPPNADFYRAFSLKVRSTGSFKIPIPFPVPLEYKYSLELDQPLLPQFARPMMSDLPLYFGSDKFFRSFWDKIILKDGSYIELSGEKVPLTCVFISGQDNRFNGQSSPTFPAFLIRVYLVANDYSCTGPVNPNWPASGTRRENWDTFLYYEIRDPTIMLPTEVKLRYRWAEYPSVLLDGGR